MPIALQEKNRIEVLGVVRNWIQHILDQKRWNGSDLASKSGLAPSTVLRIMNDPEHGFTPTLKTLQKIASGSSYPIPREVMDVLAPAVGPDVQGRGRPEFRQMMVEVRHVSSLPSTLHPITRRDISVPAPAQWEGDSTAFAFYMPDSTYDPLIKAGQLMFATKRRDPVAGDLVLLTDKKGRTQVKILDHISEGGMCLSKARIGQAGDGLETVGFDEIHELAIVGAIQKI
jgi:transcriptional regulator with XRE-family HTH domain